MYLSEVFEDLTFGELSQLFPGGGEDGGIQEDQFPKIITYVNAGLMDLYKEFPIKEKELMLQMYDHITDYTLTYDYAVSNPASPGETYRYIVDAVADPFANDVLQIQSVWDEEGTELPLNDINKDTSVYTPEDLVLQVPEPNADNALGVIYRARPVKISVSASIDPAVTVVPLPEQLKAALLLYIGYRAHIGLPAGEASKSNEFFAKYKGVIASTRLMGTINKDTPTNIKLDNSGWA